MNADNLDREERIDPEQPDPSELAMRSESAIARVRGQLEDLTRHIRSWMEDGPDPPSSSAESS